MAFMAGQLPMVMLLSVGHLAKACTYFEVRSPVKGVPFVIANTLEWGQPETTQSWKAVLHRREEHNQPRCSGGEAWQGKFGYVTMDGDMNYYTGNSLNEVGLSVSVHALRGVGTHTPSPTTVTLCAEDFATWIAGTFRTVAELHKVLPTVAVLSSGSGSTSKPGFQWAIADPSGASVVVDYVGGTLHVHDNSGVGVMTNDPEYQWHLHNLNNYVGLQMSWPDANDNVTCNSEIGKVPMPVGHGQNLLGLPGDLSPPSRFVRTFFMRNYGLKARPPASVEDALVLASGVLNAQHNVKGWNAPLPSEQGFDYTIYCVLKVPEQRLFFYRTYEDSRWRKVDLSALDFTKTGATKPSTEAFGAIDVTGEMGAASAVVL